MYVFFAMKAIYCICTFNMCPQFICSFLNILVVGGCDGIVDRALALLIAYFTLISDVMYGPQSSAMSDPRATSKFRAYIGVSPMKFKFIGEL